MSKWVGMKPSMLTRDYYREMDGSDGHKAKGNEKQAQERSWKASDRRGHLRWTLKKEQEPGTESWAEETGGTRHGGVKPAHMRASVNHCSLNSKFWSHGADWKFSWRSEGCTRLNKLIMVSTQNRAKVVCLFSGGHSRKRTGIKAHSPGF